MTLHRFRLLPVFLTVMLLANSAWPWGNEGHMMINRVAAEKLPTDVPAFLRSAEEQLAYLGPEPDRWREKSELALKLSQEPDHFIDLELVEGMTLPPDRYSFYRALETKRQQSPGQADSLWPEKVGLQPYITMEGFGRLVVAFREYRHALRDHTNPEFAERDAIFYAGWLGHYVADGANPLHTTVNYNGWTTANPNGYTTAKTIHWKMEGVFVAANQKQLQFAALVPDKARKLENPFEDYVAYLRKSNGYVEQVYQLEKAGGFEGAGTAESREFIEQRMAYGAEMLRDLWYTAWLDSAVDPPPYVPPKPATSKPPDMKTVPKLGEPSSQPGR
ncbi:MAG TPA: nuclease [Candidatus Eisenbacteria bacterium]|nr:nuclease [Candidatus Eisenbacteria bacterium]